MRNKRSRGIIAGISSLVLGCSDSNTQRDLEASQGNERRLQRELANKTTEVEALRRELADKEERVIKRLSEENLYLKGEIEQTAARIADKVVNELRDEVDRLKSRLGELGEE